MHENQDFRHARNFVSVQLANLAVGFAIIIPTAGRVVSYARAMDFSISFEWPFMVGGLSWEDPGAPITTTFMLKMKYI